MRQTRSTDWSSALDTVDIPGSCDRNNENAASTMRVTTFVRIRSSHMDLSQIEWHKDEKAETSETVVITGRKRDERKARRKEHKTRKEKEKGRSRRNNDKAKGGWMCAYDLRARAIDCIIYRSIESACAVAWYAIMYARLPNSTRVVPTSRDRSLSTSLDDVNEVDRYLAIL